MMHVPLDVNVISPSSPWECKSYKQHKTNKTGTGNSSKHEPTWKFDLTTFRNNCGGFFDPRLVISEWNIRQQNQYSILFTRVLQRQMIHVPLGVNVKIKQAPETRVPYYRKLTLHEISIGNSMICSDIWHKYNEWYFEIVIRNFQYFNPSFGTCPDQTFLTPKKHWLLAFFLSTYPLFFIFHKS